MHIDLRARQNLLMERAEKRLTAAEPVEDVDFTRAHAALMRAIIRIRLAETRHI